MLSRIAAGNPPDTITLWDAPSQYGALGALTPIYELMGQAELANPDSL
jgi:ABC-type glycerol-3-phosphate transport system substrate-binding protein